jgi:hypothetical protein
MTLSGKLAPKHIKIELMIKCLFLFKKMIYSVGSTKLVKGRTYYIQTVDITYSGVFMYYSEDEICFSIIGSNTKGFELMGRRYFRISDNINYYDVEEMIVRVAAEKARRQMEQRSLNMILKRLVNEEFQW